MIFFEVCHWHLKFKLKSSHTFGQIPTTAIVANRQNIDVEILQLNAKSMIYFFEILLLSIADKNVTSLKAFGIQFNDRHRRHSRHQNSINEL